MITLNFHITPAFSFQFFHINYFSTFFFGPKIFPKKINFTLEKTKVSENFQKKLVGKTKT
jgi:hypothetical protein